MSKTCENCDKLKVCWVKKDNVCVTYCDEWSGWHDLREDPNDLPVCEEQVIVLCERKADGFVFRKNIITTAFYENGKIHIEESNRCWSELDDEFEYDEEICDYLIPKGWFEIEEYADLYSEIYNTVIAWRELPEYKEEK